jgi:hypothetical protein
VEYYDFTISDEIEYYFDDQDHCFYENSYYDQYDYDDEYGHYYYYGLRYYDGLYEEFKVYQKCQEGAALNKILKLY